MEVFDFSTYLQATSNQLATAQLLEILQLSPNSFKDPRLPFKRNWARVAFPLRFCLLHHSSLLPPATFPTKAYIASTRPPFAPRKPPFNP
jgi:hypothetical protein